MELTAARSICLCWGWWLSWQPALLLCSSAAQALCPLWAGFVPAPEAGTAGKGQLAPCGKAVAKGQEAQEAAHLGHTVIFTSQVQSLEQLLSSRGLVALGWVVVFGLVIISLFVFSSFTIKEIKKCDPGCTETGAQGSPLRAQGLGTQLMGQPSSPCGQWVSAQSLCCCGQDGCWPRSPSCLSLMSRGSDSSIPSCSCLWPLRHCHGRSLPIPLSKVL